MILADKIIDLRKRNGWSQEELAEQLGVSRQSISKWEGAQSVPDMNRILRLSEIFGVSTDYLLRDEISEEVSAPALPAGTADAEGRLVSMEEASAFLAFRNVSSGRVALGVLLCILSPILIFTLPALQEDGILHITEGQATGLGLIALLLLVGAAVALFVIQGIGAKPYAYLEKEMLETAYGVDGMVRERRERYKASYTKMLVSGIVICVLAAVPLFLTMLLPEERDYMYVTGLAVTLLVVSAGVFLIVKASTVWNAFHILLEEEDYTREHKADAVRNDLVATIYWCAVVAGFLGYSFITNDWQRSWIVWPVAGVLYGLVSAVASAMRKKA